MGTWNTSIKGNDTFLDIYSDFYDRYNQGQDPLDISKGILDDFRDMFEDVDDKNNCFFGLALAQWETKSLDPEIFNYVKNIIVTGNDLEVWKNLGADRKAIIKRKLVLDKFLDQISAEKEKPKRRSKNRFEFETIDLVNITAPDNKKTFNISEEYGDKKYIHTGGIMRWNGGGGSVLYFTGQGKSITAKWLDSQTLEVTHEIDIVFSKKDNRAYFYGDNIKVIYKHI
jgi:hypothetical protein